MPIITYIFKFSIATLLLCVSFVNTAKECIDPVKVGFVVEWPPLTMLTASGADGLDVNIAKMVFKQWGQCTFFVKLPSSARSFNELERGSVDVVLMTSYTKERAKLGLYSAPYRTEKMRLFSINSPVNITSLEQILTQNIRIGVSLGSYYGEEVKDLANQDKYQEQFIAIASIKRRAELLAIGRVDYIIEDKITGQYIASKLALDKLKVWPYPVHDNDVHFLLRKERFTLEQVEEINHIIKSLKPKIDDLVKRYEQG
ncbi:substrate-binding periplasmic protein [Pseudoalteromonas aurantia]|uniref:Polar amino acid transport system substrate-binding protein n=1 Tax=Pseudoalteromonas aurantia 208 TaxID=1314867 RepID=A0ABR9EAH8_9GAMM|nr:transporter substrate-binding domain-containing protein [Pseudoalteromonas aurantia]MBE0367992.1 polar amino acid transport system substrate-binding protein [Pseudoalteromonas aurantia 208]